ncbi:GNAT family N-acetyltransferase [Rheinheimera sp. MMS21-TC3]|uniref:GNAT family N-acetyltransferase n=1 Tax=Rheinheimera sp. MMS21-TC3 TaxID=3072790 RepID=UPI0028C4AFD5|nr:GNAT family N-acetyltransferase [Rheinheimera sp. MMS21-TC3]WNO60937.1 GNAT family N-acetyltransferase [Rheinheimera sp. MMS21-TC3]
MQLTNSEHILSYFTFETTRLSLQPVNSSSLALLANLYGCNKTMRYIAPPLSLHQTETMLNLMLNKQKQNQYNSLILAIKHKVTADDYGICGLPNLELNNKTAEIGVMLLPIGQGTGVAVEVVRTIVVKLLNLGIETIYMQIDPKNKAAIIAATKSGFIACRLTGRYVYQDAVKINFN